jgi:hypothetical protein
MATLRALILEVNRFAEKENLDFKEGQQIVLNSTTDTADEKKDNPTAFVETIFACQKQNAKKSSDARLQSILDILTYCAQAIETPAKRMEQFQRLGALSQHAEQYKHAKEYEAILENAKKYVKSTNKLSPTAEKKSPAASTSNSTPLAPIAARNIQDELAERVKQCSSADKKAAGIHRSASAANITTPPAIKLRSAEPDAKRTPAASGPNLVGLSPALLRRFQSSSSAASEQTDVERVASAPLSLPRGATPPVHKQPAATPTTLTIAQLEMEQRKYETAMKELELAKKEIELLKKQEQQQAADHARLSLASDLSLSQLQVLSDKSRAIKEEYVKYIVMDKAFEWRYENSVHQLMSFQPKQDPNKKWDSIRKKTIEIITRLYNDYKNMYCETLFGSPITQPAKFIAPQPIRSYDAKRTFDILFHISTASDAKEKDDPNDALAKMMCKDFYFDAAVCNEHLKEDSSLLKLASSKKNDPDNINTLLKPSKEEILKLASHKWKDILANEEERKKLCADERLRNEAKAAADRAKMAAPPPRAADPAIEPTVTTNTSAALFHHPAAAPATAASTISETFSGFLRLVIGKSSH